MRFDRPIGAIPVNILIDDEDDDAVDGAFVGSSLTKDWKQEGSRRGAGIVRTTAMKEAIKNSCRIALPLFNKSCSKPVVGNSASNDNRRTDSILPPLPRHRGSRFLITATRSISV